MRAFYLATMALIACSGTASVYIPGGGDSCEAGVDSGNNWGVAPPPLNIHLVDAGVVEAAPDCEWECTSAGVMNTCDLIVRDCAMTIQMCNPVPAACQGIPVCTASTPGVSWKVACDPDASTSFVWTDDAGVDETCGNCVPGSICTIYSPSTGLLLKGTCSPS